MRPSELTQLKQDGRAISILTAWDGLSAALVEAAGADVVLVGDSLAMVALCHATTLPVTVEQMLHHTQAVGRGFTRRRQGCSCRWKPAQALLCSRSEARRSRARGPRSH